MSEQRRIPPPCSDCPHYQDLHAKLGSRDRDLRDQMARALRYEREATELRAIKRLLDEAGYSGETGRSHVTRTTSGLIQALIVSIPSNQGEHTNPCAQLPFKTFRGSEEVGQ